jgi:hypothetical protein
MIIVMAKNVTAACESPLSINQIKFAVELLSRGIHLLKQYVNVKIPVELADEVDKILEKKVLGYRSRAEFVAEAVRDKLIQVKKQ